MARRVEILRRWVEVLTSRRWVEVLTSRRWVEVLTSRRWVEVLTSRRWVEVLTSRRWVEVLTSRRWVEFGEFLVGILIQFLRSIWGRFFHPFWTILGHELRVYKRLATLEVGFWVGSEAFISAAFGTRFSE
jgi:hypothetical protein